jgi:hypothetical protein
VEEMLSAWPGRQLPHRSAVREPLQDTKKRKKKMRENAQQREKTTNEADRQVLFQLQLSSLQQYSAGHTEIAKVSAFVFKAK